MPATALDSRTALVLIDFMVGVAQRQTVHPFADVVAQARRLADAFRVRQLPVVLVNVAFTEDGEDVLRTRAEVPWRKIPKPFSELVPELGAQPSDLLITKRQWNAFYGTDLDLQLRRRGVTGIVFGGVATSIGVDSTARAAAERNYGLTFASDAMTDIDATGHEFALTKIFPRLGEVDTTDAVLALLP